MSAIKVENVSQTVYDYYEWWMVAQLLLSLVITTSAQFAIFYWIRVFGARICDVRFRHMYISINMVDLVRFPFTSIAAIQPSLCDAFIQNNKWIRFRVGSDGFIRFAGWLHRAKCNLFYQ